MTDIADINAVQLNWSYEAFGKTLLDLHLEVLMKKCQMRYGQMLWCLLFPVKEGSKERNQVRVKLLAADLCGSFLMEIYTWDILGISYSFFNSNVAGYFVSSLAMDNSEVNEYYCLLYFVVYLFIKFIYKNYISILLFAAFWKQWTFSLLLRQHWGINNLFKYFGSWIFNAEEEIGKTGKYSKLSRANIIYTVVS